MADGYLGLAPSHSLLDQLYERELIENKQFGIYTKPWDKEEGESTIRFGGFDDRLFTEDHELLWLNTTETNSWEIGIESAGFSSDEIWSNAQALIDPGYPFIGMPANHFEAFHEDIRSTFIEEPVDCQQNDWCFFRRPCAELMETMPDLKFTFPVNHALKSVTYKVPPKSFLYNDIDVKTGLGICHLGIVSLKYSSRDQFILGQSFMENYYIAYDASEPDQPRVGISFNVKIEWSHRVDFAYRCIIYGSYVFTVIWSVILVMYAVKVVIKNHKRRVARKVAGRFLMEDPDD